MSQFKSKSEAWLSREDTVCRNDRLSRLSWLAEQTPDADYLTFPSGLMSKYLYDEARYCFVYAQFLAAIILGFAFIEHTLAALFYASGRNNLERASATTLLRKAIECRWITHAEFESLERARRFRNPVTHFRKPLHDDTVEYRAVMSSGQPYSIIEEDARHVLTVVMHLVGKHAR